MSFEVLKYIYMLCNSTEEVNQVYYCIAYRCIKFFEVVANFFFNASTIWGRLLHNIIQETSRSQRLQTIISGRCFLRAFQPPRNWKLIVRFLQSFTACLKTPLTMDGTPQGEFFFLWLTEHFLLSFCVIPLHDIGYFMQMIPLRPCACLEIHLELILKPESILGWIFY